MRIPLRGRRRAAAVLVPSLLFLVVHAAPTGAATWKVGRNPNDCDGPCNFFDDPPGIPLGGGVSAAMASPSVLQGDTVKVWPGTYDRQFVMKSNTVLISAQGPVDTRLAGQSGTSPMIVWTSTGAGTIMDGFTITWSSQDAGTGGGVAAYVASGVIRNNVFQDCLAALGAGIYLQFCDLTVENNLFLNNRCQAGGGVVAVSSGDPIIRGNTFYGSTAPPGFQGAALYASGSDLTFDRNLIVHSLGGSAVHCAGASSASITCNLVWDNEAGSFGGTCVDSSGASGNVTADPYLCNPGAGDFGVCADSPAITAAANCGPPMGDPIGYEPPGGNCPACVPVSAPEFPLQALSWGSVKGRYR